MTIDKSYKEHQVFEQLSKYAKFYKDLAFSVFSFITLGTYAAGNIDTYVFSSIQGTLESIRAILLMGRINDAYSLLRKYYDSTIINVYTNVYLNDNYSLENFVVVKIDNWLKGRDKLPEYRVMSSYIRASKKLSRINELLYEDNDIYKDLRKRCNDHTHYNFYQHVLLNDNEIYLKNRLEVLDSFSKDLGNIFILHLSYLLYINEHYMMASDYLDNIDLGITPKEDSQYYVAPFVQEIFDTEIKTRRMDLATEIKNNTSMMLE